jgi:hypothetical protein
MILARALLLEPLLLLNLMQVMTGGAAGYSAKYGVMTGVVAGDAARDGAGQAADRLGAVDGDEQSGGAERGGQETHRATPS